MDVSGGRMIGAGYDWRDPDAADRTVDVRGVGPVQQDSEGRAYFRSAGWAWGDIVELSLNAAPEMAGRLCIPWLYPGEEAPSGPPEASQMFWGTNDGFGLREEDCVRMADAIQRVLRSGAISQMEEGHREHMQEWVRFLRACGGFRIF